MNILQNNPYRLLGVYSNSPTKERLANHNRMKAFLKVGKPVSFPLDLPNYLSSIDRTEASVADAGAKLTLPKDQMLYAQFWFVKMTPLDDVAFNHLIAGEIDKAEEVWRKRECASSLQNLIVCTLIRKDYDRVIACAERLYGNAQYIRVLVEAIVGESGYSDIENLEKLFIDELCEAVKPKELLPLITNTTWKNYITEKAVKPLINSIQNAIDTAKKSKEKGATARYEAGNTLKNETASALSQLRSFISTTDLQYQTIADKLAQEILQCGIDYYNKTNDDDAPQKAMGLQKYALSIAVGNLVKGRCEETEKILSNTGSEYAVRNELARLAKNIETLRGMNKPANSPMFGNIQISEDLDPFSRNEDLKIHRIGEIVRKCIPDINAINKKLGFSSDLYITVASAVVSASVNALVEVVNRAQRGNGAFAYKSLLVLRPTILSAVSVMQLIGSIDMDDKTRKYYSENNRTLQEINRNLHPTPQTSSDNGLNSEYSLLWLFIAIVLICSVIYLVESIH